ncbi:MAG TPA: LCP family protein [Armatimonadota bacterium]|nr:LCP family protein [Armatimonadota bacterium]
MGKVGFAILVFFVLVVSAGAGALLGYLTAGTFIGHGFRQALQPPFGGRKLVRILILGEDNTGRSKSKPMGLSDTVILASINFETKHVAALSIPRDTKVDLDGYGGVRKINAAHALGGPALAGIAVGSIVGVKPEYYVKTNVEGFAHSVDILGGVVIDVEKDMRYRDRRGGLYINLKKGRQLLDGDKAMQYVRFRHDAMGDIARIERQQKFLKALAAKALAPENFPKLPRLMASILKNVETDLTPRDAVYLAKFVRKVDLDRVQMAMLPGVPQTIGGASYWIADTEKAAQVVRELFFPETVVRLPKVEVLNGSGMNGAGQRVADILRQHGYEITSVGNADSGSYASSQVICHSSNVQYANQIAGIVNSSTVKQEYDPSVKADVTVIVGRNCALADSGG